MEAHKQMLDKEYETLLTSFRKELEKLHAKHQQELERKVWKFVLEVSAIVKPLNSFSSFFATQNKQNLSGEKKLTKEINARHLVERKNFETQIRREYKQTKERWKQELSSDESTTKRQRDASLQYVAVKSQITDPEIHLCLFFSVSYICNLKEL